MTRTNQTTQAIIRYLNYNGFVVWRNHNGAVYDPKREVFRKNPTSLKGVFDIIGFRESDGKHIEIEVKTGRDKMSEEQLWHLTKLKSSNCICLVVKDYYDFEKQYFKLWDLKHI